MEDCSISFTAQGDWFVFDGEGKTIRRGFKSKSHAAAWLHIGAPDDVPPRYLAKGF